MNSTARIGLPDRTALPPEVQAALDRRPDIHFQLLAHASSTFLQRYAYAETLREQLELPSKIGELAILRVAALTGCRYVELQHRGLVERAGIAPAEVAAVLRPELDLAAFTAAEAAALAFVDEMTRPPGAGSAAVAAVLEHFSERELVELGLVVDRYLGLSLLLNSLGVEPHSAEDPGGTGRSAHPVATAPSP